MTLKNLLGISLDAVTPDKSHLGRLLSAAERNLADAQLAGLSTENRFDLAYKSIMQLALAALHANGYRPLTSKPGHHATIIQTLPVTSGITQQEMVLLDALRKQRNLADYSGDYVSESAAQECLTSARNLRLLVQDWLRANVPDLL